MSSFIFGKRALAGLISALFIAGIFALPAVPAATAQASSDPAACLQYLQEEISSMQDGESIAALLPSFAELEPELITSTASTDRFTTLNFSRDMLREEAYFFGPTYDMTIFEAFPNAKQVSQYTTQPLPADTKLTPFALIFDYDIDTDELLYCRLNSIVPSAGMDAISSISPGDIGKISAPRIVDSQTHSSPDSYRTVLRARDYMNLSYEDPVLRYESLFIMLPTDNIHYDPYALVPAYTQAVDEFHSVYVPQTKELFRGPDAWLYKKVNTNTLYGGKLSIEAYDRYYFTSAPILLNGSPDNHLNYAGWNNYFILQEMFRRGQDSALDVWFGNAFTGDNTLDQLMPSIMNSAIGYGYAVGEAAPEKTEPVQLFWRVHQRIENGDTREELGAYINAYPAYLQRIEESQAQISAMEKIEGMADVDSDAWYAQYLYELMAWGVIDGYSDGLFHPERLVNRAEFAKIATLLFELPLADSVDAAPFSDVPTGEWYAPFVQAAKDAGVIAGYPDGSFRPGANVNRAEVMKMLLLASQNQLGEPAHNYFPDVAPNAWFTRFINLAAEKGIAIGYADGRFQPGQSVNRAEVIKMSARARKALWPSN